MLLVLIHRVGLLRLVDVALIVFVLATVFLNCMIDRRIRLQILFVENTVFNVFEFFEGLDDSALLAHMDLSTALLYFFKALILAVELLTLEIGDTSWSPIIELRGVIHYSAQSLTIIKHKLAEVTIDSDHSADGLRLGLPHGLLIHQLL